MNAFSTPQKIVIWILMLIAVFVLSDFLIYVGLNSTYKDIAREDNNTQQIIVYQADATAVNGRIRGVFKNTEKMEDKYLKIELYSKRDVLVGKRYIEIENDEAQFFELLFKANEVVSYKIQTVKEKEEGTELEILPKEWTRPEILFATARTFLIFWG